MTRRTLPHTPYITAVVDALTAAGLAPTEWWTDDGELDRYRDDEHAGVAAMLDAVLAWDSEHPALDNRAHPYGNGVALLWEHPADGWLWAPQRPDKPLNQEAPQAVAGLGLYAAPEAVVTTVRALLAGSPLPPGAAPYWHPADAVRRAVAEWAATETASGSGAGA